MDYFESLLFNIYKAGEENGRKHLSPRGDLDIEGSKKDFTALCGKEIRMAKVHLENRFDTLTDMLDTRIKEGLVGTIVHTYDTGAVEIEFHTEESFTKTFAPQ